MSFNQKYAIVTGAASGMGRCYALQLAEKGYGVLLVDINETATEELSALIARQYGVPAPALCLDLTQPDAVQRIADKCSESGCTVEILINNAGMLITSAVEDTDPEKLRRIVALHCSTPLLLCRHFIPIMREQGCGYILNISSYCAWMDWPLIGMYGSTKRFVKDYSRVLRIECCDIPVSITTAIFGAVDTPLSNVPPVCYFRKTLLKLGLMLTPEKAARLALKAMFKRKSTLIATFTDRLTILFCYLMPTFFLRIFTRKFRGKY